MNTASSTPPDELDTSTAVSACLAFQSFTASVRYRPDEACLWWILASTRIPTPTIVATERRAERIRSIRSRLGTGVWMVALLGPRRDGDTLHREGDHQGTCKLPSFKRRSRPPHQILSARLALYTSGCETRQRPQLEPIGCLMVAALWFEPTNAEQSRHESSPAGVQRPRAIHSHCKVSQPSCVMRASEEIRRGPPDHPFGTTCRAFLG